MPKVKVFYRLYGQMEIDLEEEGTYKQRLEVNKKFNDLEITDRVLVENLGRNEQGRIDIDSIEVLYLEEIE